MSTVERKEYQETKVMRTVSPVRNFRSSTQNLAEFDSNLDYLLEDLQNSVSRPGSSLGNSYNTKESRIINTIDSGRSNSLNRISNVKPSNPVTEYSSDDAYSYTSPDGRKHVKSYKKESYSSYKNNKDDFSTDKVRMKNSINELDSLLDDLQQVKQSKFSEKESFNNIGSDPDFHQGNNISSKKLVQRELHYGDTPKSGSRTHTFERSTEHEGSIIKDIQYTNEGTYGDIRQLRPTSPTSSSRTSTLSKQTKVTNVNSYPMEVVETSTPDINPEILAHLDPNLHPPGNTKVTTTIKTYTYEIPGSGPYPTNLDSTVDSEKYIYSANQSQTTPSKSFVYNKVDKYAENTTNYSDKVYNRETNGSKITNYQPYQKPAPPGGQTIIKETTTTRNYQPSYIPEVSSDKSYVYNETVTTRNYNDSSPYPDRKPYPDNYIKPNPPKQESYVVEERHNTVTNRDYPPRQETRYIKEVHDTNTVRNVGYPNGYPPNEPNKTVIYKHESHTTNNYGPGNKPNNTYPNGINRGTNEPVNIHYKYKSETKTTNNYKTGYPPVEESQPLLPRPFPTDNQPDGPPKRLDELMATIGNEPPNSPYNAGFNAHEQELAQKKKIESLKQQQLDAEDVQKKEPVPLTKNVSGPPVYYPPGHEMFAKKEEMSGGWRGEGAYARESGKYKYEAESGSKSKSSSGAAIVPVCLPLCCGLPCTIL